MNSTGAGIFPKLIPRFQKFENQHRGSFRWSLVLAVCSGLSAVFMFLTHVVAVRVLDTASYGEFSSAIALVGIVGVGASSVQAVTVKRVQTTNIVTKHKFERNVEMLLLVAVSCLVGGIAYLFLNTSTTTSGMLVMWVPAAVMIARANGEIQGRDLQGLLHGGTSVVTLLSLAVSLVLALVAASVATFLLGRLVVTLVFAFVLLRSVRVPVFDGLRFLHPNLLHTTIVVTTMWFAANMDVLLSRATLNPDSVGEIAIAAMLVNSVLLMPGLIAAVSYPRALARLGSRSGLIRLLIQAVSLTVGLQVTVALALFVSRGFLVDWLAGSDHESAKRMIVPLALAYIPLGASIVVSQFVLALGSIRDSGFMLAMTGVVGGVLVFVPDTAEQFVHLLHLLAWFFFLGLSLCVCELIWRSRETE